MVINPIVGVSIPIIRIPIKGWMTIPNIATFDHGTYAFFHLCEVCYLTNQDATLKKNQEGFPGSLNYLLGAGDITVFTKSFAEKYDWPMVGWCLKFIIIPSLKNRTMFH